MYPAHPAHPAQTACIVACSCAGYFSHPAHPAHSLFFLKNMEKIVCGKENLEAFTGLLKELVPEFYTLAKALYKNGMIQGLRGATLETGYRVEPIHTVEAVAQEGCVHCEDCRHWQRDDIGAGLGLGCCPKNAMPSLLKWPKTPSCPNFEVTTP